MPSDTGCDVCYCSFYTHRRVCLPSQMGSEIPPPSWSAWSAFSGCSAPCGTGTRRRSRTCVKLCANDTRDCAPDENGRLNEDQQPCNQQDCKPPVDCQVSDWTNGTCFAQCNGVDPKDIGQQLRLRRIIQHSANGGQPCPSTYEVVDCTRKCPVDFLVGQWSEWSETVKPCVGSVYNPSCGIGERVRTRPVLRPPANGGKPCRDREYKPSPMPCNETTCSGPETVISCANRCWRTCADVRENKQCQDVSCVQGCGCSDDRVREGDSCVRLDQCNCAHPDNPSKLMPAGSTLTRGCNTCTCTDGQFVCETKSCAQDCEWTTWKKVGGCNVTCGSGKQLWSRSVAQPASGDGAACSGPDQKYIDCFGDEGACCRPDDVYSDSGRCETTCQQLLNPGSRQPDANCHPGCQCKPGMVRDEVSGACISLQNCFACRAADGTVFPNGWTRIDRAGNCSKTFCVQGMLKSTPLTPEEVPPCTQADQQLLASSVDDSVSRVMDSAGACCFRAYLRVCRRAKTVLREIHRPGKPNCKLARPIWVDRCSGACPSSHQVLVNDQGEVKVMGVCQCCKPTSYTAKPPETVACKDGTKMQLIVHNIEKCRCVEADRD